MPERGRSRQISQSRQPRQAESRGNGSRESRNGLWGPVATVLAAVSLGVGGYALARATEDNGYTPPRPTVPTLAPEPPSTPPTVTTTCPGNGESEQVAFTALELQQPNGVVLKVAEHLKSEAPFNGALLFNGDLPPAVNDQNEVHVYPSGSIEKIEFYQGTLYELCPTADPVVVARRVANEEHAATGNQDVVVVHNADGSAQQVCDTRQGAC